MLIKKHMDLLGQEVTDKVSDYKGSYGITRKRGTGAAGSFAQFGKILRTEATS